MRNKYWQGCEENEKGKNYCWCEVNFFSICRKEYGDFTRNYIDVQNIQYPIY